MNYCLREFIQIGNEQVVVLFQLANGNERMKVNVFLGEPNCRVDLFVLDLIFKDRF